VEVASTPARAFIDPQPSSYQDAPCEAYVSADVLAAAKAWPGDIIRISTQRGRQVVARVAGSHPQSASEAVRVDRFARQAYVKNLIPHQVVYNCCRLQDVWLDR